MFGSSSHGGWFGFATSNNDWIESKLKLLILVNILSLIWGLRYIVFEGLTLGLFLVLQTLNLKDLAV